MLTYLTLALAASVLAGALAVIIARQKNRHWLAWGVSCLFAPPLVIILALLPTRSGPPPCSGDLFEDDPSDPDQPGNGWRY